MSATSLLVYVPLDATNELTPLEHILKAAAGVCLGRCPLDVSRQFANSEPASIGLDSDECSAAMARTCDPNSTLSRLIKHTKKATTRSRSTDQDGGCALLLFPNTTDLAQAETSLRLASDKASNFTYQIQTCLSSPTPKVFPIGRVGALIFSRNPEIALKELISFDPAKVPIPVVNIRAMNDAPVTSSKAITFSLKTDHSSGVSISIVEGLPNMRGVMSVSIPQATQPQEAVRLLAILQQRVLDSSDGKTWKAGL